MNYKSKDIKSAEELKTYLKENDESDPLFSWNFFKKKDYIDDLATYLRASLKVLPVSTGYGNYNSPIVIVLNSFSDLMYIQFLKDIFLKLKMDFNNFYVTAYKKADTTNDVILKQVLELELKALNPSYIITIDDMKLNVKNIDVAIINKLDLDMVLVYSTSTENDNTEKIKQLKSKVWSSLKPALKCYKA